MKMLCAMGPTVFFVVYGQIMAKWRIQSLFYQAHGSMDRISRLQMYLKDPLILSTYAAALAGSVAWIFVVERYEVATAFPVYIGLTVVLTTTLSLIIFVEQMTVLRGAGLLLIIIGISLVSQK